MGYYGPSDPDYFDEPDAPEPCCPPFSAACEAGRHGERGERCLRCGGCEECARDELRAHQRDPLRDLPPVLLDEDEECPF